MCSSPGLTDPLFRSTGQHDCRLPLSDAPRLEGFTVDATRHAEIASRMFVEDHVDDFRIRPNRIMGDLDDVVHQLAATFLSKAGADMAFNERHPGFSLCHFRRSMSSRSLAAPSTYSGRCSPCSTKLMPRPSRMTKKMSSFASPVAS